MGTLDGRNHHIDIGFNFSICAAKAGMTSALTNSKQSRKGWAVDGDQSNVYTGNFREQGVP